MGKHWSSLEINWLKRAIRKIGADNLVKVISFKTSEEVYKQLKSLNKSFRDVLEPLLLEYLEKLPNKRQYTLSIPKEITHDHSTIVQKVDMLLADEKANK